MTAHESSDMGLRPEASMSVGTREGPSDIDGPVRSATLLLKLGTVLGTSDVTC